MRDGSTGRPTSAPSSDAIAMMTYDANKKSALIAYLLWFFVGWLAAHRFYLGRPGSVFMMLLILVAAIPLWAAEPRAGLLAILVLVLWWLVDALLIPGMTRSYNRKIIKRLAR